MLARMAAIAAAMLTTPAHAAIVNGSFEAGFNGWASLGAVFPIGPVGPYSPTDGHKHMAAESLIGGPEDEDIARQFRLPASSPEFPQAAIFEAYRLDFEPGENPLVPCFSGRDDCYTAGSAGFYQTFNVEAGQRVTFDYNWLAGDGLSDAAYATISIRDAFFDPAEVFEVILLGDSRGNGLAPLDRDAPPVYVLCGDFYYSPLCNASVELSDVLMEEGATGWVSASIPITRAGVATLGFAVLNASTEELSSALLVDNIRLVPNPSAALLFASSLAGLAWRHRSTRS